MRTVIAEDFGIQAGDKVHAFELAGLGKAPYRYTGMTKGRSGCDYCATGIMFQFWLVSADGRRFKVGCDCIFKSGDSGLRKAIARAKAEHDREVRRARDEKKTAEARALFMRDDVHAKLCAKPHPFATLADRGATLGDYVDFLLRNGGSSGRAHALKLCRAEAV